MHRKDQKNEKAQKWKTIFKEMIISKDEMDKWKKKFKKGQKLWKNKWFDWLIIYVPKL